MDNRTCRTCGAALTGRQGRYCSPDHRREAEYRCRELDRLIEDRAAKSSRPLDPPEVRDYWLADLEDLRRQRDALR